MKRILLIIITTISIILLPKILLCQQVNQGYHLAITPYAELYQKDSVNKQEKVDKSLPVSIPKDINTQEKSKPAPAIKKCKSTSETNLQKSN